MVSTSNACHWGCSCFLLSDADFAIRTIETVSHHQILQANDLSRYHSLANMLKYKILGRYTALLTITAAHDSSNSLTPSSSRSTKSQCPALQDPLISIPKSLTVCKAALVSSADWNELAARTKTRLLELIITTNKFYASAVIWACMSLLNTCSAQQTL